MAFEYKPAGVCSSKMEIELDGDKISSIKITGGCNGNLQGISRLVEGMDAREAIGRLRGIRCGWKKTSCPDQLSIALERAINEKERI